MCQNAFSPCLQGIRMRRTRREEQKLQMRDQIKKKSIQSLKKIKMQEYTEFRKKESKILSNFKLMAQKKARSF